MPVARNLLDLDTIDSVCKGSRNVSGFGAAAFKFSSCSRLHRDRCRGGVGHVDML